MRKYRKNPETEVRELLLFIENDGKFYNSQFVPICRNLEKKYRAGKYDSTLATKLWKYLADEGAKKYAKDFGGTWNRLFSVADRIQVAKELEASHRVEMEAGNFQI